MLTVCCFLWRDPKSAWRSVYRYGPEHVAALQRMLSRYLSQPHELVCITDDPHGLPEGVRPVPLDASLALPGKRFQKLMIWRPDAAEWLGARILMLDLDIVLTQPLDPLVDRPEDVVLWANPAWPGKPRKRARYNTSIVLLSAGARRNVWEAWDPDRGPRAVQASGLRGTDQVWVSLQLAGEATWTAEDGVYSWAKHVERHGLPDDARAVMFHGPRSPCELSRRHHWIRENYVL